MMRRISVVVLAVVAAAPGVAAQVEVPCLLGMSGEAATTELAASGFLQVSYLSDPELRNGQYDTLSDVTVLPQPNVVVWQDPLSGSQASASAEISLLCVPAYVLADILPGTTLGDLKATYPGLCFEVFDDPSSIVAVAPNGGDGVEVSGFKTTTTGSTNAGQRVPLGAIVGVVLTGNPLRPVAPSSTFERIVTTAVIVGALALVVIALLMSRVLQLLRRRQVE